jgi:hypothetical protein
MFLKLNMTVVEFLGDDIKKPKEKHVATLPEKKEVKKEEPKKEEPKKEELPVEEEKPKKRKAKTPKEPKEPKEPKKPKLTSKIKTPPKPDAEIVNVPKIETPPVEDPVAVIAAGLPSAPQVHRSEIVKRHRDHDEKEKVIDFEKQKRKETKRSKMYNQIFPK